MKTEIKINFLFRWGSLVFIFLLLSGCSKGLDISYEMVDLSPVVSDINNEIEPEPVVEEEEEVVEEVVEVDSIAPLIEITLGPSLNSINQLQSTSFNLSLSDSGGSGLADVFEIRNTNIILNTISGDATCDTVSVLNGTTVNPIVTLSNCRGVGTLKISVAAGVLADKENNQNIQSALSDVLTIDAYCGNYLDADTYDDIGSGTQAVPYRICTAVQLVHLGATSAAWDKYFELMQDIDLVDIGQNGMQPIGNITTGFSGSFNGNNFKISHFDYNDNTQDYIGFFGYVNGNAVIKNLNLEDSTIVAKDYVGSLVGEVTGKALIIGSSATGALTGEDQIGGLVGYNRSVIANSFSNVTVSGVGSGSGVGGFIGVNIGVIGSSFSTGNVNGVYLVGGFVGNNSSINYGGFIGNSYSTGNIISTTGRVGGFAGYCGINTKIINSYSIGNVIGGDDFVGGFIGYANECIIKNTYSIGNIDGNGSSNVGRFAGYDNVSTINNNYVYSASILSNCSSDCDQAVVSSYPNITDFYNVANEPILSWDFINLSAGGKTSDFWIAKSADHQKLWFEEEEVYVIPFVGEGTMAEPYIIDSIATFSLIRSNPRLINSYFQLTADLNFNSTTFYPIGNPNDGGFFRGVFIGGGHEFSNIDYQDASLSHVAIFGLVASGSELSQFNISSSQFNGDKFTAAAIGQLVNSNLSNVIVESDVEVESDNDYAAGIVALAQGLVSISHLENNGIVAGVNNVGGVVGYIDGLSLNISLNECINKGDITSSGYYVGGIMGYSKASIINSYSEGNLDITNSTTGVGGLVGYQLEGSITESYAIGDISITGAATGVGGLAGQISGTGITSKSYSTGNITISSSGNSVGGFVGLNSSTGGTSESYATGDLVMVGGNRVGGFSGQTRYTVSDSYATGDVSTVSANSVGGFVGYCYGCTLNDTYATGNVNGASGVGGLSGYTISLFGISYIYNSYATGNVNGTNQVGGLVGAHTSSAGIIGYSFATGNVVLTGADPNNGAGGIAGYSTGTITQSFSTGNVTSTSSATAIGGVVGFSNGANARVNNSFATGTITGNSHSVGGVVGQNASSAQITATFSTGLIDGDNHSAGIVGYNVGSAVVTNSFATGNVLGTNKSHLSRTVGRNYDSATSSGNYGYASSTITGCSSHCNLNVNGTHASLASFFDKDNLPMSGWNFTDTWREVDNDSNGTPDAYPVLQVFD